MFFSKAQDPDFIIIGAQKCGTTSLFEDLTKHVEVQRAFKKEMHFFDHKYELGIDHYRKKFASNLLKKQKKISGEATPYYLFHPLVPKRMSEHLEKAKLILILRNPIERAISHYNMNVRRRDENRSFVDSIANEIEVIAIEEEKLENEKLARSLIHQNLSYLSRGLYFKQIQRWMSYYPKESFLVLFFEEYFQNQEEGFNTVCKFLEIEQRSVAFSHLNKTESSNMKIGNDLHKKLEIFYQDSNRSLFQFLNRENIWGY